MRLAIAVRDERDSAEDVLFHWDECQLLYKPIKKPCVACPPVVTGW